MHTTTRLKKPQKSLFLLTKDQRDANFASDVSKSLIGKKIVTFSHHSSVVLSAPIILQPKHTIFAFVIGMRKGRK